MRARLATALLAAVWLLPASARGYETGTTHAGLTAEAVLASGLHSFLRQQLGLSLGLFTRLRLQPAQMARHEAHDLQQRLARLDRAGGYRPGSGGELFPAQWVMAGSVLAEVPASLNQHHFYSPSMGKGLNNPAGMQGWLVRLLSLLDGSDTARAFFTGTGFDMTGMSALDWVQHKHNSLSLQTFQLHLRQAVTGASPRQRGHALARALMSLGGALHVLQDMASPSHVRNDFLVGHLQRLGGSDMHRGSAYERYVALRYGQHGVPTYSGPAITRPSARAFFSTPAWDGLADLTSLEHFSPGTLPPAMVVLPGTEPGELLQRLTRRLPLQKPGLGPLDLACARSGRSCYLSGPHGARVAYGMDQKNRLRFFLDQRCHQTMAERLLPLAVGYSTGLIDHLLRGRLELSREEDSFTLKNAGVPLRKARAQLLAEDKQGRRARLDTLQLQLPAASGQVLGQIQRQLPPGTAALVVLLEGTDDKGDQLTGVVRLALAPDQAAPASQPTGPGLLDLKLSSGVEQKSVLHRER